MSTEARAADGVVLDAADGECLHVVLAGDAAQVRLQARLEVGVDLFAAFFGGEDDVMEGVDVGVRHGMASDEKRDACGRPVGTQ
jgi:hypothetical protein